MEHHPCTSVFRVYMSFTAMTWNWCVRFSVDVCVGWSTSVDLWIIVCQVVCPFFLMPCWSLTKYFILCLQFISHFKAISASFPTMATITTGNPMNQFEFKVDFPSVTFPGDSGLLLNRERLSTLQLNSLHSWWNGEKSLTSVSGTIQNIYFKWALARFPSEAYLHPFLFTPWILSPKKISKYNAVINIFHD